MKKTTLIVALLVLVGIVAAEAAPVSGYGIVKSSALNYGDGGWAGWSVPSGKVVTCGGFQLTGGPAAVSVPGTPGSVWPHYTYGATEYGWVVRDNPDGASSSGSNVYGVYTDLPPGYGVFVTSAMSFSDGGWGGWSVPAGKVILGGGFYATAPVCVSAPSGPNQVWPHYTYGANEYGWVVRDYPDGLSNTITIYVIYADKPDGYEIIKSSQMNFSGTGWAGWSVPSCKVVLGGGFESPSPVRASAPSGPNQVWPHYTYGPNEYGWCVQSNNAGQAYIYAIAAYDFTAPGVTAGNRNFISEIEARWKEQNSGAELYLGKNVSSPGQNRVEQNFNWQLSSTFKLEYNSSTGDLTAYYDGVSKTYTNLKAQLSYPGLYNVIKFNLKCDWNKGGDQNNDYYIWLENVKLDDPNGTHCLGDFNPTENVKVNDFIVDCYDLTQNFSIYGTVKRNKLTPSTCGECVVLQINVGYDIFPPICGLGGPAPSIPNMVLWLDAEDPDGNYIIDSPEIPIATWVDKTAIPDNANQTDVLRQPTTTLNVITGGIQDEGEKFYTFLTASGDGWGSSDVMYINTSTEITSTEPNALAPLSTSWTANSDKTLIVVFNPQIDANNARQTIFEAGGPTTGFNIYTDNDFVCYGMWNRLERKFFLTPTNPANGGTLSMNGWHIAQLDFNKTSKTIRAIINGTASSPNLPFSGLTLDPNDGINKSVGVSGEVNGTRYHDYNIRTHNYANTFNGFIGDVMLFNKVLDATELGLVYTYLNTKYGTSVATPAVLTKESGDWFVVSENETENQVFQASPNPFTATTRFDVNIANEQNVRIEVYSSIGELMTVLYDGKLGKGLNNFVLSGDLLNPGMYTINVRGENFNQTIKTILVK